MTLKAVLAAGDVRLVPIAEHHREGLRAACPANDLVWDIYPIHRSGDDFDRLFDRDLADTRYVWLIVLQADIIVGITAYMLIDEGSRALEIGGTYLSPPRRGTGLNMIVKHLMIDHAICCGFYRIQFRIDQRNTRSQAAVRKLGAVYEGTLRASFITWSGHVRNTAVFSILADEWQSS